MLRIPRSLFEIAVICAATPPLVVFGADDIRIVGYIYNCELSVTLTAKDGRSMPIAIVPKAVFEIQSWPAQAGKIAKVTISIFDRKDAKLFQGERDGVTIDPGTTSAQFKLGSPLHTAAYADVSLAFGGTLVKKRISFSSHTIRGRVTSFSGDPLGVAAYVTLETSFEKIVAGAACNDAGYYEMVVPRRAYHTIQALDEHFGNTHLERYGHNLYIDRDTEINFRIGEMELYRLSGVVTAENTVLADFSVFSIHHFLEKMVVEQRKPGSNFDPLSFIADIEHYPRIEKENVELYVDGDRVEIWTVERRHSSMRKYGSQEHMRPYWLIEGSLPTSIKPGRHELKVVVTTETKEDGRVIVEKGEASYYGLDSW